MWLLQRWDGDSYELLAAHNVYDKRTFFNHPSCQDTFSTFGATDLFISGAARS